MRTLLLLALVTPISLFAQEPAGLVDVWKLVSWQVIVENEQEVFGVHPKGYLSLTREGRAIVLTTGKDCKPGTGDTERDVVHKSMLAYSGKYRVEGSDFMTRVDASWKRRVNGSEQRRHFRIEGDKLFVESAPAPSITFPGETDYRRIVWQREK